MRIMVCDTSNATCCCGIYDVDRAAKKANAVTEVEYKISFEKRTHSETFMPIVHEVITASNLTHYDLDCYASTVGPGSFTGIRIGLSAVKGMALAASKPCIPISSTRALAYSVENVAFDEENTVLIPCFDARNNRVFAQAVCGLNPDIIAEENAYDADELAKLISEKTSGKDMNFIALGNGADTMVAALERLGISCESAGGAFIHPRGIALAAWEYLQMAEPVSGAAITASYCARASAERFKK